MTHAESIALVADYLRSKDDIAGYINDEIGIAQIGRYHGEDRVEALELLDTAEAMNFAAIGEQIVNKLVAVYLPRALEWRREAA